MKHSPLFTSLTLKIRGSHKLIGAEKIKDVQPWFGLVDKIYPSLTSEISTEDQTCPAGLGVECFFFGGGLGFV